MGLSLGIYTCVTIFLIFDNQKCASSETKVIISIIQSLAIVLNVFYIIKPDNFSTLFSIQIVRKKLIKIYMRKRDKELALELIKEHKDKLEKIPLLSEEKSIILTKWKVDDKEKIQFKQSTCVNCMNELYTNKINQTRDKVIELHCKHVFHYTCLMKWFKYKFHCPICKEQQRQHLMNTVFDGELLLI